MCIWNNDSFVVDRRVVGRGFIMLEGMWTKENKKIFITNVYAPCVEAKLHGESKVIQWCFDDNHDDNKR